MGHRIGVRIVLGILALVGCFLGYAQQPEPSQTAEPAAAALSTENPAVMVVFFDGQDRQVAVAWAIPVPEGYLTVRSLLAIAARAEIILPGDLRQPVQSVLGEDVESNLALLRTDGVAQSFGLEPSTGDPDVGSLTVRCGETQAAVGNVRARDIPVFGVAMVGDSASKNPLVGCPVFGSDGAWHGVVTWENPFAQPSLAMVPAFRVRLLTGGEARPWEEWQREQLQPDRRLKDSLLSEAMQDLWREDYRTAVPTLNYLLENDVKNGRVWYFRGYAKAMLGRRKEAAADYEYAVYYEPKNAEMRLSLGLSYALLMQIEEATAQLEALEQIDPTLAQRLAVIVESLSDSHAQHEHESASPHSATDSSPGTAAQPSQTEKPGAAKPPPGSA